MDGTYSIHWEHDNGIRIMYAVRMSHNNVYALFKCILKKTECELDSAGLG